MSVSEQHHVHEIGPFTAEMTAGGSIGEAIGGGGAIVLAILGLAGVLPGTLMAIAAIAVGGGLLFEGGAIASRISRLMEQSEGETEMAEIGGGISAEFVAGGAGVVLGILSLLGLAPMALMPITAIVLGAAVVFGSGLNASLRSMAVSHAGPKGRYIANEAIAGATTVQVLVGLSAVVLGILSLVGVGYTVTLTLIAFLALGSSILLSGTAIAGKMLRVFQH